MVHRVSANGTRRAGPPLSAAHSPRCLLGSMGGCTARDRGLRAGFLLSNVFRCWRAGATTCPAPLRRQKHERFCKQTGGMTAPHGAPYCGGHVHPLPKTQGLQIGHMAGRCTRRGYATFTIATACYCQPLLPGSQALLRSQAGPQAGAWLAAIPTQPGTTLFARRHAAGVTSPPAPTPATLPEHVRPYAWVWRSSRPIWRSRTRVPPHRFAPNKDRGTCLGACRARGAGSGWPGYPPAVACTHYSPERCS